MVLKIHYWPLKLYEVLGIDRVDKYVSDTSRPIRALALLHPKKVDLILS